MNAPDDTGLRLDAQRPWPGLSSFGESDSAFFFGRDREIRELRDLVERSAVVVLYGQSGLGKTSLLRAGLFPALKQTDHLPVWVRLDFSDAAPEFAAQVLHAVQKVFAGAGVEAPRPADGESLWSYFHRADADFWGPRNRLVRPLIVLDQFEELFTLGQRDAGASHRTDRFARELEAQIEQRPPPAVREMLERHPERAAEYDVNRENVRFVVSLREDYLPHLDAWRDRMPSLLSRRYRLEPMSRAQALDVVLKGGVHLVDDKVAHEIVGFVAGGDGQRQVEPAILSVVCEELNARRMQAGLAHITRELLSGERGRIIEDFYERAFEGVPEGVRDWVEDELLTASGHRDRAALEDARRVGLDTAWIERLVGRRVLHSDERNRVVWVEFTHDLLTQPALRSRIARERRKSEAEASRREREVRDKLRRSRRLTAVFALMALLMAGLTWWSFVQRSEAQQQRQVAEEQRRLAEQQTAMALQEKERADAAGELALRRGAEAAQAAAAARLAASQADAEAQRAVQAELQARANLSSAESTALQVAGQAVRELERQWLDPTGDSVRIVAASLNSVDPLARQFAGLPALRDAHRRLHALAAVVMARRGDAKECMRLVERGGLGAGRATSDQHDTAALSELAAGQCASVRGAYARANEHFDRAMVLAPRHSSGGVLVDHILLDATVAASFASLQRYRYRDASRYHQEALKALRQAEASGRMPKDDLLAWRLAILSLESEVVDDDVRALALREQLHREAAGISAARRDSLAWRSRILGFDLDRAHALVLLGRKAEAEQLAFTTLEQYDRWLSIDADHWENQLRRNNAARMRAEILHGWQRRAASLQLIDDIEARLRRVQQAQPERVNVRYQLGVLAWMRATYASTTIAERRTSMERSAQTFASLANDVPEYGAGLRSWAVALRGLGEVEELASTVKDLPDKERTAHQERAKEHYAQALRVIARLGHAADHSDVSDVAGGIELKLGGIALAQQQALVALDHYQRASRWYRAAPGAGGNAVRRVVDAAVPDMHAARALRRAERLSDADAADRTTIDTLERARNGSGGSFEVTNSIAWVHRMAATDHLLQGRLDQALNSQLAAARIIADELRRDPLSRQAEDVLGQIDDYVDRHIRPAVDKSGDSKLRKVLEEFRRTRPSEVVDPGRERPRAGIPPIAGDWQHLEIRDLLGHFPSMRQPLDELKASGWQAVVGRRLDLPFYDDAHLVEIDVTDEKQRAGVAGFLVDGRGVAFRISGNSTPVHAYNKDHNLTLRTEEQARMYLRFMLTTFGAEEGEFRVIDHPRDLMWDAEAPPEHRRTAEQRIEPLRIGRSAEGSWTAQGTIQYGAKIYLAKLTLERDGNVGMARDRAMLDDLALATVRFDNGIRLRDGFPALRFARRQAAGRKDWPAAAKAVRSFIDAKRDRTDESKRAKALEGEHLQLSWYLLLARDPASALAAADEGLALQGANLPLQTNRAHALLLVGRRDEALALYREHLDKRVSTPTSRLWQDEILNDLKQFELNGLRDPRFAEVKALMEGRSR